VDRSGWVWWHTWVVFRPCKWVPSSNLNMSQMTRQAYMQPIRPRPFKQDGYGGVPGCWACRHRTFMCHKYHVKHTSKQCNIDRLKSGSKRDTNETPTCAVPMHVPQTNTLWWGEEGGTTKALLYTWPKRVGSFFLVADLSWRTLQMSVLHCFIRVGPSWNTPRSTDENPFSSLKMSQVWHLVWHLWHFMEFNDY